MSFFSRYLSRKNHKSRNSSPTYPFWHDSLKFPDVKNKKDLIKDEIWEKHLNLAKNRYAKKTFLPKKTLLYHGSAFIDPLKNLNKTDDPFFFGLDFFIAAWYATEWDNQHNSEFLNILSNIKNERKRIENNKEELKEYKNWTEDEINKLKKGFDKQIQ